MKNIVLTSALTFLSTFVFGEQGIEKPLDRFFPSDNNEATIKSFIDRNFANSKEADGTPIYSDDLFHYLFDRNKQEYILPFIRTFKRYYPEKRYRLGSNPDWTNPINLAIQKNDKRLVEEIVRISPELVSMNDTSGQFSGIEPISYAVRNNDLALARLLIPSIKNLNTVVAYGGKERPSTGDLRFNLLSLSTSQEMDDFLIKNGINQIGYSIDVPDSHVTDDNVNLRSEPNINSKVLVQLSRDEVVTLIAFTFKFYTIGKLTGRWVMVRHKSDTGWIFEPFLYIWAQ